MAIMVTDDDMIRMRREDQVMASGQSYPNRGAINQESMRIDKSTAPMEVALNELRGEISELEQNYHDLYDQLNPIMGPPMPSSVSKELSEPKDSSELVNNIYELKTRLARVNSGIYEAKRRVEI